MVSFVPVRKILKVMLKKCGSKKRVRTSKNLKESFNIEDKDTKWVFRVTCVIVLLAITCCVRFLMITNTSINEYVNTKLTWIKEDNNTTSIYENINGVTEGADQGIPTCYNNITGGDEIFVNKSITKYPEEYPEVSKGGYYRPKNCKSRHTVAILVPYRHRKKHLFIFLYNIHPFLIRQKLEYRIFVIEQKGTDVFNRAKLFNAGFVEIKKYGKWRCVIFHDVDLLPLDDRILYSCPTWPRHMCAIVAEVKKPKFRSLFGGVSSMEMQHFQQVNGYSNLYWGWGGEDNDMFWRKSVVSNNRIRAAGLPLVRYRKDIARYTTLKHSEQSPNRQRFDLLSTTTQRYRKDGISNLKYKVESVTDHHLHTHIIVDINPDKINTTKIISQWLIHFKLS